MPLHMCISKKFFNAWALTCYLALLALTSLVFCPVVLPSDLAPSAATENNKQAETSLKKTVPMVDTSLANVPLDQVYFDTFDGGSVSLSEASESLILRLRDAIPPLTTPKYDIAKNVDWLGSDDLVLTYLDEGRAYAYPIKILNYHEIVNEVVDGFPILISYCPLCRSGIVYSRVLEGKTLTFGNTSALFESDMVMYDHQTGSYWHQVGGNGIVGKLSGKHLTLLPSIMTTWSKWKALHPNTQVLSQNTGFTRNYNRDPFTRYPASLNKGRFIFPVSKKGQDSRLHPADEVLAIEVGGVRRAYPLATLGNAVISDQLGDAKVVIFSKKEGPTGAAYFPKANDQVLSIEFKNGRIMDKETSSTWTLSGRAIDGPLKGKALQPVPSRYGFWFAIVASYPEIDVFRK